MDLQEEIIELEKELAEKRRELEEQKRLEEKQITIQISKFNPISNRVQIILSKYRSDVVDYLRYKSDRIYNPSTQANIISLQHFEPFLEFVALDPAITLNWESASLDRYNEWKNKPDLTVDIDKNYVTLELGPKMAGTQLWLQYHISSFIRDDRGYRFSIAEFYLFPETIEREYKNRTITYSEKAKTILFEQLEKRRLISELANATDCDIGENPLKNGYELRGHQKVAIKFVELSTTEYMRSLVAYDMGTGKTAIAIGLAERHPEWKKVLIICPASLKTNWRREIKKFTNQDAYIFSGIEPDALDIDAIVGDTYRYYIINYDIIGRQTGDKDDKVMKWVEMLNVFKPDYICIDECHYIKNLDSGRSKGVRELKFKNTTPMSGTMLVNRPLELYPNLHIVAPDAFNSPTAFLNQFTNNDGTARNVKKLHDMMLTYMIRRTRKDIYGDKIHIERIPMVKDLSPQARILYQKILEGIYISLRRPDYQTAVASIFAELIRCKQTCSADNIQTSADLAVDAFEETGHKVLIFSQFKDSQYGIEQILGPSSCVVNGDVVDDTRYSLMDKFQDPNSGLNYWISNILEGLTLTEAHTVIFNDIWWTPKDHSQAEGRCFGRDNDPHGGNSYWLENDQTIDQFLNALIMKKTSIFNEVIDGVRDSQEEQRSVMSQLIQHLRNSL